VGRAVRAGGRGGADGRLPGGRLPDALVAAIPAALALDRGRVHASARRRLDIRAAAAAYESALAALVAQ